MLRRWQGRKVTSLVFKHHRGGDDLAAHSHLQHHQSCVVGCKQTSGKGLVRLTVCGDRSPVKHTFQDSMLIIIYCECVVLLLPACACERLFALQFSPDHT